MRHGETTGNRDGVHQGWGEVALTEKGEEQARTLGRLLERSGIVFRRYICSDIYRAKQTAALVFPQLEEGVIEYDTRLREIDNNIFAGQRSDDLLEKYGPEYKEYTQHLDYSPYGGESAESMLARTASFLKDLKDEGGDGNIAVLTHGGVIHAILANVLHSELYLPRLRIGNCSITRIMIDSYTNDWCVKYINLKADPETLLPRI